MKRIGFIGTGWTDIGQIKAFQKSGLIPQAIFSRSGEKANIIAEKYKIPEIYTDWKKLIESENIDFISIVLPTWLHSEVIKYSRLFDKPFICEAPFSSTKEIQELLNSNKNLEIIDYELRFTPHFIKLKELIQKNEIGKVKAFSFEYLSGFAKDPQAKWDWSNDLKYGGGYLNLVGGHFIDLANFLFGDYQKITKIEFSTYKTEREDYNGELKKVTADDQAILELKYFDEISGRISISQISEEEKLCFIVKGTEGILKVENNELFLNREDENTVELNYNNQLFSGFDNNLFTIGSYFLGRKIRNYLENGKSFGYPNLEDSLKCQEIIEKAYKTLPNNV